MEIGKQTAAQRLIHAAIRSIVREDDPLASHVLIVAAFDLLREYGKAKKIVLQSDFLSRLPAQLGKEVAAGIKAIYNFARHSDRDPDLTVDIATLTPFTDAFVAMTVQMYVELFGGETRVMALFRAFVMVHHPHMMGDKWAAESSANPNVKSLAMLSRSDQLASLHLLMIQADDS